VGEFQCGIKVQIFSAISFLDQFHLNFLLGRMDVPPEKYVSSLGQELDYIQDFFFRFFDHIDPESGPVKGW
jgi:hypothetical protein